MYPPSQLCELCDILPVYTCANRTLVPPKHTLAPLLVLFPAILLYQTPLRIPSYLYLLSISWFSLNFAFTLVCVSPALSPATPLTAQCTLTPYILSTQLLWSAAEEWVILQQPAPVLLHLLQLLCYSGSSRQMAGCRPARRERANLPAGIAGGGCWGRDRWLVSAEARLLWSRQPRPGKRPVSPRRRPALHERSQNNQSHALQDKRRRWQVHAVCR